MFLIDSSAWIEYLRPQGSRKVKERLREVIRRDEAFCCGIVLIEVLRGARSEKDYLLLRDSLQALPQIPLSDAVIARAAHWGYLMDRKGKTASTTDLIIAAASYKKARLLHLDNDFKVIASFVDLSEELL